MKLIGKNAYGAHRATYIKFLWKSHTLTPKVEKLIQINFNGQAVDTCGLEQ